MVINVLTTLREADVNFDIETFDYTALEAFATVEFWSTTSADIDITVIESLTASMTTDIAIINAVVRKWTKFKIFDR